MKLKRLIIQGFKSFKDRSVIHFDDGITGIVGPNGCGKSNIVDALFWVMGEQSAKHLRGSTMKDVIFSGSSKYTPGGFAEATLVLENTNGKHIHINNKVSSPTEIQLTRKLYRNGETEYRINGEPCRLKDIQEVFMDTGAGAKSYSIIAQGEINRLVQAKPEERRMMIEEVAGITKFKLRKRESMKKIEQTQANLARLQDLQQEIEKNLKSLEKQAEKAERARTLREKIQRNELVVTSHRVFEALKNFREGRNRINELTLEVENSKIAKDALEISLEDERIQREDKTAKLDDLQKEYNEVSKKLAAAEERLNYLAKSLTEKEKQADAKARENEEILQEIENRKLRLQELEAEKERLVSQNEEAQDLSDLEDRVTMLKDQIESKDEDSRSKEAELLDLKKEWQELDQLLFRNNSKLEEYSAQLQDLTTEVEALEKQYSGVSGQMQKEREIVQAAEVKTSELMEKESELKLSLHENEAALKESEDKSKNLSRSLIQTESKISSLKEINASLEGVKSGTKDFLEENGTENFNLLGQLLHCESQYSKAVEALLKDWIDYLVSLNGEYQTLFSWIEGKDSGLDVLIPHNKGMRASEALERLRVNGCTDIISLKDILKIEGADMSRFELMLEGFYIVPDLTRELAESLNTDIQFKAICNTDGTIMVKHTAGSKILSVKGTQDQGLGVVERTAHITELEETLISLKAENELVQTELDRLAEVVQTQRVELEQVRTELIESKSLLASKKSAMESKLQSFETANSRLNILQNRKTEISKQRLEILESEDKHNKHADSLKSQIEEMDADLETLKEDLSMLRDQYSQDREELVAKQMALKSFEDRMKSIDSQMSDVDGVIARQDQRRLANIQAIETFNTEIEQTETDLKDLEEQNRQSASELSDQEEVLSMLKDDLVQLLHQMQTREDQVKDLNQRVNKAEKEKVEIEGKLGHYLVEEEQVVKDIFEKYQIDLRQSLGGFLEYSEDEYLELRDVSSMYTILTEDGTKEIVKIPYEFHRRYGQDLKECEHKFKNYKTELARMGEINWQAIEDYERQKLRFDFLSIQETELKQSLEDLNRAISHIDEKSKIRFKGAFEEVNTRFEKVFPIIFGGGSARLNIVGDLNDADCGIDIIAQPPGKKMQNINLMSGGEKALTAVSLIFSIFLVKPSPFCLLDEVDAPLDDANVGRFNELLREMSKESQFILITHNKKTMELNDTLYGVTMQEPGVSKAVSVQLH
ncbi:MAG: chromosome segregation protein SMC [Bdellovibrio sp. CG12_big_fil_rev_8_21_14_0_65_39_13]|nr:MAG: chromosome segregation protein SMC [Bdellovibrio sp. CG22_combo_CG10-13_8_21_14_all_39_27]PIQ58029.1 MAG: chromosome segregation protein SMC [Bdellovibrio sp. CG12_big_fil_rev_8_21_14_0_65_39_13]